MYNRIFNRYTAVAAIALLAASCKTPAVATSGPAKPLPETYASATDTANVAKTPWRTFFTDPNLVSLIDEALKNNQEFQITQQELEIAKNDIRIRKGNILPTVGLRAGSGLEKVGRYTSQGAGDASTDITPGREVPDPLSDFTIGAYANWEVDIWKKLRNSKKAAVTRYLATTEGRNFAQTNLIAEVANSYYELLALDNQLSIVRKNIVIQKDGLEIVKIQKEGARATELAVQKFQAEVLKSQSLEWQIVQQVTEEENHINFLLGRYPQPIERDRHDFLDLPPTSLKAGVPSQLLENRPDIKQAELELAAAKLDVKVAKAEFYPTFEITGGVGFQAFKTSYLFRSPQSLLYNVIGDLAAPLINRNAIKAEFKSANARQLQALYNYERVVLNAYIEVSNQVSNLDNIAKAYDLKSKQVEALNKSIEVSNDLFRSARADYFEVLMTQRDVLEAKLEMMETKQAQFNAAVEMYRNLGGGWK